MSFASTPSPRRLFGDRLALPAQKPKLSMIGPTIGAVAARERAQLDVRRRRPRAAGRSGSPRTRRRAAPSRLPGADRSRSARSTCSAGAGRPASCPVKFSAGHAGEQDRDEVAAAGLGRVVEHRVEQVLERRHLGSRCTPRRTGVVLGVAMRSSRSFLPSGITTSLIERVRRAATPAPRARRRRACRPRGGSRVCCRLGARVDADRLGSAAIRRPSCAIGTWSAIVCAVVAARRRRRRPSPASGIRWDGLNGRRPARSNTEPRSTKNGSSRWPAKTLIAAGQLGARPPPASAS